MSTRALRVLGLAAIGLAFALLADVYFGAVCPDGSIRQLVLLSLGSVLVALSLQIVNGLAGQFSIGHAGFLAVGAYASAITVSELHDRLGGGEPDLARSFLVVPPALCLSAVVAGAFGLIVGLPCLRLRGDYLAIVTLGFAEVVRLTIGSARLVTGTPSRLTRLLAGLGGQNGYSGPEDLGVPLYAGPFWILTLAAAAYLFARRLKASPWGRALRAVRDDELAAGAIGISPTKYKLTAFVIAASFGGVAGGLLAVMRDGSPVVQPDSYGFQTSFDAVAMVILGGSGSVTGAALGAIVLTTSIKLVELLQTTGPVIALRERFPFLDLNALRMMLYAAVLIVLMVRRPGGLFGEREPSLLSRVRGS